MPRNAKVNIFLFIIILAQFLAGFLLLLVPSLGRASYLAQMTVTYALIYPVPILFFFVLTKWPPKEVFLFRPLSGKNIVLILCISIVCQPVMSFLSAFGALFSTNQVADTMIQIQTIPLWQIVVSLGLYPAVFEELVFRGIVYSGFRNVPEKTAIFMTGLLFGMMHLNFQQFFYAAALGMLFCFFVSRTRSLWASILSHFVINGSQLTLFYFSLYANAQTGAPVTEQAAATLQDSLLLLLSTAAMAVIFLPALIYCLRLFSRRNPKPQIPAGVITDERVLDYNPLPGTAEPVVHVPFLVMAAGFLVFALFLT